MLIFTDIPAVSFWTALCVPHSPPPTHVQTWSERSRHGKVGSRKRVWKRPNTMKWFFSDFSAQSISTFEQLWVTVSTLQIRMIKPIYISTWCWCAPCKRTRSCTSLHRLVTWMYQIGSVLNRLETWTRTTTLSGRQQQRQNSNNSHIWTEKKESELSLLICQNSRENKWEKTIQTQTYAHTHTRAQTPNSKLCM